MKKILLALICLGCAFVTNAQPISVSAVPITSTTVGMYEKFEAGIQLSLNSFNNQFDPEEIDVYVVFTHVGSGQTKKVNAFWYQDFAMNEGSTDPIFDPAHACDYNAVGVADPAFLNPIATPLPWRVRFSNVLTGYWNYQVFVKHVSSSVIYASQVYSLNIIYSPNKGFISVNPANNRYFEYKNSKEAFIPLGLNVMDKGSIVFNRGAFKNTKDATKKLAEAEGNTIRIFMSPEQFGIEWSEDGIGKYLTRQNRAYTLDEIFKIAESLGVKIDLVLETNHAFHIPPESAQAGYLYWKNNPYRTLLGPYSPVNTNQYDFFVNQYCRKYFMRKLRYIIARYGYSSSLLSYEFWNEAAIMSGADPDIWENNNVNNINNGNNVQLWHALMSLYTKSLDPDHMVTSSSGWPGFDNFATSGLDYVQDHYYGDQMHILYNYSVFAQYSTKTYDRPYITGEVGGAACHYGVTNFTSDINFSSGNYSHHMIEFHNAIWGTLFNGSAAPAFSWDSRNLMHPCWGGAYKNFKPMSTFLNNDNFFSQKLTYLANTPAGGPGPKDMMAYNYLNNSIPVTSYYPNGLDPNIPTPLSDYITTGITTSNDALIDVFAAQSQEGKIYGWLHYRKSYWYELPHKVDTTISACIDWNDNIPVAPSNLPTLRGETMTINNIECDGMYKVDFYSTYPDYDIDGDGNWDDGGTIAPFSQTWMHAHCGSLTVPLPQLAPISDAGIYAPDYAFKISKVEDDWSHSIVTGGLNPSCYLASYNSSNVFYSDVNGALRKTALNTSTNTSQQQLISSSNPATNEKIYGPMCVNEGSQVFYKGTDSRLQCYYPVGAGWSHMWLTDFANNSQNVGSYMAYGPSNVFYQGIDQRLHRYFFNPNTNLWVHSILPNNNDPNTNVLGAITVDPTGTQVFYVGVDHRLQCYYAANGGYNHIWLTNWSNTSENAIGDVKMVGTEIYYAGEDGKLHKYYFSNNTWTHTLIFDQSNQPVAISHLTQIAIVGNGDQIFFTGAYGQMEHLYNKQNNTYIRDFVVCQDDYEPTTDWSSGMVICDNQESVYYVGHSDLHLYAYDNSCTPRSQRAIKRTAGNVPDPTSFANIQTVNTGNSSSVYPNPFKDKLNILIAKGGSVQVRIENSLGQQSHFSSYICTDNQTISINTAELPQGIYFVTIVADGAVVKKSKILKM